jgi:hypothetical protein
MLLAVAHLRLLLEQRQGVGIACTRMRAATYGEFLLNVPQ